MKPYFNERYADVEHTPYKSSELTYHQIKRVFDVCATVAVLLLLWPLFLAVALAVRLDSKGAVLFKQERVGSRARIIEGRIFWEPYTFTMYKFRSMYEGCASSSHEAFMKKLITEEDPGEGAGLKVYKMDNDVRITRVGRFLRATSLDELPQIFNVLRGDMSLVGPRPALQYEVDSYKDWHYGRLSAQPGVTGYWQVKGRSNVSFHTMVELDIYYVNHKSVWLDLRILVATVVQVVRREGAV